MGRHHTPFRRWCGSAPCSASSVDSGSAATLAITRLVVMPSIRWTVRGNAEGWRRGGGGGGWRWRGGGAVAGGGGGGGGGGYRAAAVVDQEVVHDESDPRHNSDGIALIMVMCAIFVLSALAQLCVSMKVETQAWATNGRIPSSSCSAGRSGVDMRATFCLQHPPGRTFTIR